MYIGRQGREGRSEKYATDPNFEEEEEIIYQLWMNSYSAYVIESDLNSYYILNLRSVRG